MTILMIKRKECVVVAEFLLIQKNLMKSLIKGYQIVRATQDELLA